MFSVAGSMIHKVTVFKIKFAFIEVDSDFWSHRFGRIKWVAADNIKCSCTSPHNVKYIGIIIQIYVQYMLYTYVCTWIFKNIFNVGMNLILLINNICMGFSKACLDFIHFLCKEYGIL